MLFKKLANLFIVVILSTTAIAHADSSCLRFLSNQNKVKIVWKKKCDVIVSDFGEFPVLSAQACITELANVYQEPGRTIGVVVDIVKDDGHWGEDLILAYDPKALITERSIVLDYTAAAPELLMRRTRTSMNYDRTRNEVTITKDQGIFFLSNHYKLTLACH